MNYYSTPCLDFQDGISGAQDKERANQAINISPLWGEAVSARELKAEPLVHVQYVGVLFIQLRVTGLPHFKCLSNQSSTL